MKFFTIGYGGRNPEEFLDLLKQNNVRTLVDVRLRPDRASMGIWAKAKTPDKGIEKVLGDAGIGYCSFVELGNIFIGLPIWQRIVPATSRPVGGAADWSLIGRAGAFLPHVR